MSESRHLGDFLVDASRDGDLELTCFRCYWSHEEWPNGSDLSEVVSMAQGHRCNVVIEGAADATRREIEPSRE